MKSLYVTSNTCVPVTKPSRNDPKLIAIAKTSAVENVKICHFSCKKLAIFKWDSQK